MIVRVLTASVRSERAAAFNAKLRQELTNPRLLPGPEDLVDHLQVTHHEALDVDLDPDGGAGMESP